MTDDFKFVYKRYYPNELFLFDANYTPNNACSTCHGNLLKWQSGAKTHMPYVTPVQWAPHDNDVHDAEHCYACINFHLAKSTAKIKVYRRARTGTLPVPHNPNLDPPERMNDEKTQRMK